MNYRTLIWPLGLLMLTMPAVARLQGVGPQLIPDTGAIGTCNFVTGNLDFNCLPLYLVYIIRILFGFAGGMAVFNIAQGGYEYALSGVPANIVDKESAKKRISNAIIGLVVVVLAYLIIDTIISALFIG